MSVGGRSRRKKIRGKMKDKLWGKRGRKIPIEEKRAGEGNGGGGGGVV